MEIKVNKEIRNYTESIFFGLSFRQFIFSALACGIAVLLYFLLRENFSLETLSWVCILGAIPFGILGFVKYNGMKAEEFVVAFVKSEILMPKVLTFEAENIYENMLNERKENEKLCLVKSKIVKKRD